MVNCIECKLIAFDLLNSSWKPICINPQNVAIINPMKHVPSIHYGIPMPFKYMQNMQSMQVFMQQKKTVVFFCTRNLNCAPMILYGKYQLIQTYRVGINIWSSAHQNESITVNFYINLLARVIQGLKMVKCQNTILKCDPLCQCAVLNSLPWHTRTRIHTTIVT